MKNLFKNLMLVAVAAMAFTACSKDNNDVNAVSKITRYEFTANIADDTRSGFAEKEEGATAYKSEWFGNETLKLFVTDYNGYNVETTASINEEGQFTLELENAPESFFMSVCSPAESWASEYSSTIPAEQTPLANSVDPKAHLLQCSPMPVSGGQASINLTHAAAYGKMTVNGVAFAIDHVVVDLKGSFYESARELSYTINADNVENNTFWFATEPIDVAEFTVTAYGAGDEVVAKTVDMTGKEKPLAFGYGSVSTFSVSGLEAVVEPEEPTGPTFTSATVVTNWGLFDQVISFYSDELGTLEVEFYNPDLEVLTSDYYLKEDVYSLVNGDKNKLWYARFTDATHTDATVVNITITVAWVDDKYHITFENVGGYNDETFFESAVFVGSITGGSIKDPDSRTKLAAPTNIQTSVAGKTITITWDAVEHADGYTVSMYNPVEEQVEEFVTDNQYVFTALNSNTKYNFKITATASDDNPTYRTSDEEFFDATTEDTNPKIVLSKEAISFTADGGNDVVDVTLKNIDGDFTYTVDADWLTVTRSGASLAVSAPAYDNESEGRSATITITAGDLTKEITVTQSKKAAEGGPDGTEANPHIFESPAQGYAWYQLVFGTATDGATLIMELNSNIYSANLGVEYSLNGVGPWYSSGNMYTAPNGTTYFNADFTANSTAIVTKNADGVQYDILFKIVAGGVTTYYKTTVPSTF